ncbi:MAG: type II secretion system F family protein [Armatimonadota bacterium]
MPVFQYVARDQAGQQVSETLAFNNEIALREYLRKNNLFVVEIAERRRTVFRGIRRGVGLGDLIVMTRQLRTMINAGMPLVSGLEALAEQTPNAALAEILEQVARSVGHGHSLAKSLAQYPRAFPEMLVALIAAGEDGGRLPETLQEAGRQLELQAEIRQKVISAMVYPCFTLLATFGTILVMLFWIVPVFQGIYKDLNATLPPITMSIVWLSEFVISYGWLALVTLIVLAISGARYYQTPEGRVRMDGWKLKAPLVGQLFLKAASANLTLNLSGLLDSGVPLIQALNTAANACGNEVLAEAARNAARRVAIGRRISDELEGSGQFPIVVTRMIAIAEDVGTLPMVLREIAASYIVEVEYALRRIVGLVEPIMVLVVGAIVGYVLLALYYPIFLLGETFQKGA